MVRSFEALLVPDGKAEYNIESLLQLTPIECLLCTQCWSKCLEWISSFLSAFYFYNIPIPIRKSCEFPVSLAPVEMVLKFPL